MGIPIVWIELNQGGAGAILSRPEVLDDLVAIAVELAYAREGVVEGESVAASPTDAILRGWIEAARRDCWRSMMSLAGDEQDPDGADRVHQFFEGDVSVRDGGPGVPAIKRYSHHHLLAAVSALADGPWELRQLLDAAASRGGCVISCYY
jgi:hypothetical protein